MSIIRCKSWVIDGYIGVGKSSAIRNTGTLLKKHSPNINFRSYQENVEEWQDYNGVNLLKRILKASGKLDFSRKQFSTYRNKIMKYG